MSRLYAAVAPSPWLPEYFINYLSTDRQKVQGWAEDHYTRGAEEVEKLEPGCEAARELREGWRIIEIPFEEFFFLLPDKYENIPELRKLDDQAERKAQDERFAAMQQVSDHLQEKFGPISEEIRAEVEKLMDQEGL